MNKLRMYNPDKHHRRSIRIPGYDYTQEGWYYVTICTYDRIPIFGKLINSQIFLNAFGKILNKEWIKTETIRPNIKLDEYVIMPNHMHGIIRIVNDNVGAYSDTPLHSDFESPSKTIGSIIRGFKSAVTKQINKLQNTPGIRIWQRNYWEHVIRDENDLTRIRKYIIENPIKWKKDKYFFN